MKVNSYFILFFSFLYSPLSLYGQLSVNDSTQAYQYWAKRGSIEMVYAYMLDYTDNNDTNTSEIKGKKEYKTTFIDGIGEENLAQISNDFKNISEFLKAQSWKTTEEKVFQLLYNNYKNLIPIDQFFGNGIGTKISNAPNWLSAKKRIIIKYKKSLSGLESKNKHQAKGIKATQSYKKVPESEVSDKSQANINILSWMGIATYLLPFILGLIIGGFIVYFYSRRKIYSILNTEKRVYLRDLRIAKENYRFNYIGLLAHLKKKKDEYKLLAENLNNKYNSLDLGRVKKEYKKLKNENERLHEQLSKSKKNEDKDFYEKQPFEAINKNKQRVEEQTNSVIYFSIPENDGSFIINKGKSTSDARKFYKIEFSKNSSKADLYFISGSEDKRALNRMESYLRPVCKIENISIRDNASKIELISPGTVIKVNDRWVIDSDKKVKIRLV